MPHVSPPPATFNFAQHLIAANALRAGKTALIDDAGRLSYGELAEQVRRFWVRSTQAWCRWPSTPC
jgi:benzoate-CoA ligase